MQWPYRLKKIIAVACLLIVLMVTGIVLANCHGPTPLPATTPSASPSRTATRAATSTSPPVATPAMYPTGTYVATAWPATWTAIPTATMEKTATIATHAPPTPAPSPTATIVQPHTGRPATGEGVPLAWLYVVAGLLLAFWGVMWRLRGGRRK